MMTIVEGVEDDKVAGSVRGERAVILYAFKHYNVVSIRLTTEH